MHILFVFVDGIGIGTDDAAANPFAGLKLSAAERLAGHQRWVDGARPVFSEDLVFLPIDANLGTEGLPQSGTGQASLFTGMNCAKIAGRHYGPFPHSKTKPVIAEHNLFRQLDLLFPLEKEPAAFANAYPEKFFGYVEKTDRWTVTTRCCLSSRTRIRGRDDLRRGTAIPADIVGRRWPEPVEPGMMPGTEAAAAERLAAVAEQHHVTLFEYYLTDKAGHRQSAARAEEVLNSLDAFLERLMERVRSAGSLLLLTSDHGNLEDLSTKSHTRNPVPFAAYGRGAAHFRNVRSVVDVTPTIMAVLRRQCRT